MYEAYRIRITLKDSKPIIWYQLAIPKYMTVSQLKDIWSKYVGISLEYDDKIEFFQKLTKGVLSLNGENSIYKVKLLETFNIKGFYGIEKVSNEVKRLNIVDNKKYLFIYNHVMSPKSIFENIASYFLGQDDVLVLLDFFDFLKENEVIDRENYLNEIAYIVNMYANLVESNDITQRRIIRTFGLKHVNNPDKIEEYLNLLEKFDNKREYGGFDRDYYIENVKQIDVIDEIIFFFSYVLSEIMFRFGMYDVREDDFLKKIIIKIANDVKEKINEEDSTDEEEFLNRIVNIFLDVSREILKFIAKDKLEDLMYYVNDNIALLIDNNKEKFNGIVNLHFNKKPDSNQAGNLMYFIKMIDDEDFNRLCKKYSIDTNNREKDEKRLNDEIKKQFGKMLAFFDDIIFDDIYEVVEDKEHKTLSINIDDYLIDAGFFFEIYYYNTYFAYLPEDLVEIAKAFLNQSKLRRYRDKIQKVIIEAKSLLHIYGIIEEENFGELISDDLSKKELEDLISFLIFEYKAYRYSNYICHIHLSNPSLLLNYLRSDQFLESYEFTKEDINELSEYDFYIPIEYAQKLFEIAKKNSDVDINLRDVIEQTEDIVFMFKSGLKPDDVKEYIAESYYRESDMDDVVKVLKDIWNNTHIWVLKGNKPISALQ